MNKKKPLVSIITPSYNQGKYIEETLLSVLRQDYPNIEYIVVDGGSTDNSVEVIRKYEDHLAFFVSEEDYGQSDAINKGFSKATGEFIAWLNSDDVYTQHAISRAVEAFQAHPHCGFIFGNVLSIDMYSHVFNTMTFGNWGLADLLHFKIISQPGVFMRKKALERVGYLDPRYNYIMDHHLWIKIAMKYPLQYIDEFLAAARYHPEAKNLTGGSHYGDEAFTLYEWMKSQPDIVETVRKNQKEIEAGAHHLRAHYLLDVGKNWKAFKSYFQAIIRNSSILRLEYRRIVFALVNSLIPVSALRAAFLNKRTRAVRSQNYDRLLEYIKGE